MYRKYNLLAKIGRCSFKDHHQKARLCSAISSFRTTETNPANLDVSNKGRFYRMKDEVYKTATTHTGLPQEFQLQSDLFGECSLLVRQPFLDLKNCIMSYDPKLPTMRYILHGPSGSGKTMTMACLLDFGVSLDYIIVHVPWVPVWTRFTKEFAPSTTREGYYDHTVNSVMWLSYFKMQNADLLQKLNLKTSKDYAWSKRESTPKDSNIMTLLEHGIARPIHAAECIYALIAELKLSSTQGKCKTMVLVDGVNALFYNCGRLIRPDKTPIKPSLFTAFEGFMQAFKSDWSGGVVVCTVDKLAIQSEFRESDMPRYLLTKEGWELFDPFVPIQVDNYSSQEVQTTIDYFLDRKWLQHPNAGTPEGRLELEFLSTRNPRTLMLLCNSR